ncbi:hypothetical protein AB0454_22975 [Streptomyces sp. NPDC093509]|uniref:hypothetical protein n=1 Tax=Streptomyces sp. NPDC093509 TaxID=3154982 RepID=UPI00344FECAF
MGAQLVSSVHLSDPDSHETVILDPGTCPEPRLAALVTNPSAWVDGKLPRLPKKATDSDSPTGDGQDDASGDASDASDSADTQPAAPAAKKPATKKAAAAPRGRSAAGEGTSGE